MVHARAGLGALWCAVLSLYPVVGTAQEGDGFVPPPGMVRLTAGARYWPFEARFAEGGREPLGARLSGPLTSLTFAPLGALETDLNRVLAATGSAARATPENLSLGELDARLGADLRVIPFGLEVGVVPRVSLSAGTSVHRTDVLFQRFGLGGGTVGLNPDVVGNEAVLARLGEEFRALGGSLLLPTAGSALGAELLARVREAGAGELRLPEQPGDFQLARRALAESGVILGSEVTPWQMGDLEIGARVRMLSTFGALAYPAEAGTHYRLTGTAAARLPIGSDPQVPRVHWFAPPVGLGGWEAGAEGDVFLGERWWGSGSLAFTALGGTEVSRLVAARETPLAGEIRRVVWSPGDELRLSLAPRYRLARTIALGARYELAWVGASSFAAVEPGAGADPAVLSAAGGVAQWLGVAARYTTLPDYFAARRLIPLELAAGYERALAGPDRAPAGSRAWIQASLFYPILGRR